MYIDINKGYRRPKTGDEEINNNFSVVFNQRITVQAEIINIDFDYHDWDITESQPVTYFELKDVRDAKFGAKLKSYLVYYPTKKQLKQGFYIGDIVEFSADILILKKLEKAKYSNSVVISRLLPSLAVYVKEPTNLIHAMEPTQLVIGEVGELNWFTVYMI